jgi:hypothetical protein
MTNEEILEELYYIAESSGVFKEFSENVNHLTHNSKFSIHEAVERTHLEFVEKGLISQ